MQLRRRIRAWAAAFAFFGGLAVLLLAEPALAKSSLGIGTAEVTATPGGPFAPLFAEINRIQREFFMALRQALVAMKNGSEGVGFLVGLSFVYGVFHAAGPGHGKAVISSYVLANEVQLKRGILLSFVSALLQAATALLVVGIGWFLLRGTAVSMTDATNWLEIASYALIAAFGGWLLARKLIAIMLRRKRALTPELVPLAGATGPGGAAGALSFAVPMLAVPGFSPSAPAGPSLRLSGAGAPTPGSGPIMRTASRGMPADICTAGEDDCRCGRPHMPDPAALGAPRLSLGTAASAVFAVGLRPCSGAIVVLTFALVNGLYAGGILSVLAMALGTAITVSAIAALAVFAKGTALRFGAAGGMRRGVLDGVELLGAVLVLALGLLLLGSALA